MKEREIEESLKRERAGHQSFLDNEEKFSVEEYHEVPLQKLLHILTEDGISTSSELRGEIKKIEAKDYKSPDDIKKLRILTGLERFLERGR